MTGTLGYKTTTFPAQLADLEFTMQVPEGFQNLTPPLEQVNFDEPETVAPLLAMSSPVAAAIIAVSARPAYETGSVLQWLNYLAGHHGLELQNVRSATIGDGAHPAILAEATQAQENVTLRLAIAAFEDGGRFVMVNGLSPVELWPSFGEALTHAVHSMKLARPMGQKYDLDSTTAEGWVKPDLDKLKADSERGYRERGEKRQPALAQAEKLVVQGKYDEAEAMILKVDSSIEGGVEIARLYERHLTMMVEAGMVKRDKARVEVLFARALSWAQRNYPDPHTAIEAEQFEAGREADRARLVKVLGYQPKQ